jgi:E3 ubiquitin-protein ligase SIAH1
LTNPSRAQQIIHIFIGKGFFFLWQCEAGHSACSACHALLPKECYACGRAGAYRRNTTLEDVVGWYRVPCPNEAYGCRACVTYHEAGAHQVECPCAPCRCSEPGCAFVGSPPMLLDHLAAAPHSWPVDTIRYGVNRIFSLPATLPRRLLVAEDGIVFLVSSCAMGASHRGASVVCVRASAAAAAGQKYKCSMIAPGRAEDALVQMMEVPSCSELSEATVEEVVGLVTRNKNLPGSSMEMRLGVRIEKVPA